MKKLVTFLLALVASISMMAQVTTSNISGKIMDNGKGPLPGATVVATHVPSGTQYYAVADANGVYRLLNVRPGGPYRLEFRMVGFQTTVQNNVNTALGETKLVNVNLPEEAIGLGEVTISAEALPSGMDTDRAGATTTVSSEQIATLPTISRSLNDVLALTPQAATTSNGFALGGGNYRQSYVTVDGAAFNNAFGIGGNLPAGGSPISLDALEAMTINITPFDVRQSGFTGGAINAVTKSGTNDLKISIYDYFTNDGLMGSKYGKRDEYGHFPDPLKLSESLNNTVGVSVGGPIIKNKLFYFVNFEYESDVDPGQTRLAREDENDPWGPATQFNRPTIAKMEEIKTFLKNTYNYDPGRYQNYSISTPDYKLLARMDWNASENDRVNLRYSLVRNKYSTSPSSSVNPLSPYPYDRDNYGRVSQCALYFESSRYFQEQNFSSVAAEWNHSFLSGRANNMLRATYSHQYEPRSFVGDLFPTVDILENIDNDGDGEAETKAVYTSFGPDPFTYGNLREVSTAVVTDEVSYLTGMHNFTFGGQFEFDNTKNGYMQGGAGYYVYNSWDDFVNQANPAAFAITYGNNEKLEQVFPSFNYLQGSLYAQDEINLRENFKLIAGLRVELPYYPSIAGFNTNKEFLNGWDEEREITDENGNVTGTEIVHHSIADGEGNTMYGLSTADMPKARVNFSPRLGFNYDILGNRSLILRGGTGLYTGRLPFVWIVSTVGNSNCMQNQYINAFEETNIGFYTSPTDIINNNTNLLSVGDLPAPQSTTLMDKELRMPQSWKSSLALDATLPGNIKATVEGIFNKDITTVAVTKLGIVEGDPIQLPGEPGERTFWVSERISNSLGRGVTPYLITNVPQNGYYYSVTGQLSKEFDFGLNLMAAYTYAEGKNVTDGIGDQITSAFNTNSFGVNGSNVHEMGYSSYVSPNHLLFNMGWTWAIGQRTTETVGLYYEGFNHCYVGNYSYTRYSYTMTTNVNGDGGAHSLAYIPTEDQLLNTLVDDFVSPENAAAYNDFIKADKYLSAHRGEYAGRGEAIAPWRHTFNFKYNRTYKLRGGESYTIGVDVKNLANLFYRGWGNIQRLSSCDLVQWKNGKYTFQNPTWNEYSSTLSTWSAALSLRFNF